MSAKSGYFIAKRDYEYRGAHVVVRIRAGQRYHWSSFFHSKWPDLFYAEGEEAVAA